MPKKVADVPVAQPGKIICPACRSEIASDGGKLFAKSKTLADLEEAAEVSAKIGPEIDRLEKEVKDSQEENKKLKAVIIAAEKKKERDSDPDDELR